jgi:hypothetical protein
MRLAYVPIWNGHMRQPGRRKFDASQDDMQVNFLAARREPGSCIFPALALGGLGGDLPREL